MRIVQVGGNCSSRSFDLKIAHCLVAMRQRILLLCATARGHAFLERLFILAPDAAITVCSFCEEEWEPPFLDRIRTLAESHGAVFKETRNVAKAGLFADGEYDLLLAVSWRYMVPVSVYGRMRIGSYVFHDSQLPEYRGFSPTVWAMINGEDHTGVTLFEMGEDVDTGPVVDQEVIPIEPGCYIGELMPRVTEAYLRILERNIVPLLTGHVRSLAQDDSKATYTCRRMPEDNRIRWEKSARTIVDLVHAISDPYPGAYCLWGDKRIRILRAAIPNAPLRYVGRIPGRVVSVERGVGVTVLAGEGAVLVQEVRMGGQQPMAAEDLLRDLSITLH